MIDIKNILIIHDFFHVNGGAEKFITILRKKIKARTIVGWINKDYIYSENFDRADVLCDLPLIPRVIQVLIRFLFKIKNSNNYDVVIYSGIFSILNSLHQKKGKKIYYCHTLPRFIYGKNKNYINRFNYFLRPFLKLAFSVYKKLYLLSLRRMDCILTNSIYSKRNIKEHTNLNAHVLYPPIEQFHNIKNDSKDYYLSIGRLEKYKRVDLIIKAFNEMPDKKLIVTSGGSQLSTLKSIAKENIKFTGWLTDKELQELINRSIACVYIPKNEDFGMSAAEANALGKPVIISKSGGIVEIIKDKITGIHLEEEPTIKDIKNAVEELDSQRAKDMFTEFKKNSNKFSDDNFIYQLKNHLS